MCCDPYAESLVHYAMTILGSVRRKSVRALQQLHAQEKQKFSHLRITTRHESSFVPKRVLVVGKLSRYHFEKLRKPSLSEEELKAQLLERGSDYDAMLISHQRTKDIVNQVTQLLKELNVDYRVVNRSNLDKDNFDWADLVLPIGGDGTFLLASNLIFDNKKPILGINSYPGKSEGFLMLPWKYTRSIPEVFEKLRAGHYGVVMRTRIRTTLHGDNIWNAPFHMHEKGRIAGGERFYHQHVTNGVPNDSLPKERLLPWLALNEVYMGESLSVRTSMLQINLDDDEKTYRVKSSGLCVSTGTGSTSWYRSINTITPQSVREILQLAVTDREFSDDEIGNICDTFNKNLQIGAGERKLCYTVRDMISMNVWPVPKGITPRGHCKKIAVKSQCYDAGLVLDGGIAVPFTFGTTAVLDTHPDDALRTFSVND